MTNEQIEKAIKTCFWRKEVGGIGVCRAVILPCTRALETGVCDTLIKLAKEGEENVSID